MQTDDPPQLPGGGADGFQKAIEPDIPGHRDLEHIVDDEIPGENDKQDYPAMAMTVMGSTMSDIRASV